MSKSHVVRVSTGEVVKPGDRCKAVRANANGNKPTAIFRALELNTGLVVLEYSNGNRRPTTPGKYGLAVVGPDET